MKEGCWKICLEQRSYTCLNCLSKYPLEIEYNYFPLDKHMLEVVSLFKKDRNINYDAFTIEYSEIYKKIYELNDDKLILFENKLFPNDEIIQNYSQISTLLDTDIIILTNILLV